MKQTPTLTTRSPDETKIVGASLAPVLLPGDVVSLSGDLGAGKTVFVQGVASGLGVDGPVTSPTFTIVHQYDGRHCVIHLDVYRLDSIQEVLDLGFEELVDPEAILLVEWGNAVAPLLPRRYLEVEIRHSPDAPTERSLVFHANGMEWARKVERMLDTAELLLAARRAEGAEPQLRLDTPDRPARDHRQSPNGDQEA